MSLSTNFSATNQSDANHSVRKKNIDSPEKKSQADRHPRSTDHSQSFVPPKK